MVLDTEDLRRTCSTFNFGIFLSEFTSGRIDLSHGPEEKRKVFKAFHSQKEKLSKLRWDLISDYGSRKITVEISDIYGPLSIEVYTDSKWVFYYRNGKDELAFINTKGFDTAVGFSELKDYYYYYLLDTRKL